MIHVKLMVVDDSDLDGPVEGRLGDALLSHAKFAMIAEGARNSEFTVQLVEETVSGLPLKVVADRACFNWGDDKLSLVERFLWLELEIAALKLIALRRQQG